MGLISAAVSSVSGVLSDSWKEVIEPDDMSDSTLLVKGVAVKKGSNKKGTDNYVSNGSVIHVYPTTLMLLMDGGKLVDYSALEVYYEENSSSAPSIFNGELKDSVKETWKRIQFGGVPSQKQYVYYINTAEIKGIKFGTRNPVNYFDNFYNAELFLRAHGSYSIKITDPIKFFTEFAPKGTDRIEIKDLSEQLFNEFMDALQSAINQMSVDGVRISAITSKSRERSKFMADVLDADWNDLRGIEVCSVGLASISYDDESKALINMRNKGAMMSDPTIREGFVQSSVAQGMQAAGSNTSGAANAFMGMGMGMNAAGGFMSAASQTNAAQMAQQQAAQQAAQQNQAANGWKCSCGTVNTGNFCSGCGSKKPENTSWTCSCGTTNTGRFCSNCGSPKPAGEWVCSCGTKNTGNFCSGCACAYFSIAVDRFTDLRYCEGDWEPGTRFGELGTGD